MSVKVKFKKRVLPRGIFVKNGKYVFVRMARKGQKLNEHIGPVDEPGIFEKAEAVRNRFVQQARSGKLGVAPEEKRLSAIEACDIFWEKYARFKKSAANMFIPALRYIKEYFAYTTLDDISRLKVQGFRDWLENEKKMTDATTNKYHRVLVNLYNRFSEWADDEDGEREFKGLVLRKRNPAHLCPKANTDYRDRTVIVTPAHFDIYLECAPLRTRRILLGLIHTLLRQCDLKHLRKSQNIDRDRNVFLGLQRKTKQKFNPPITPEAWRIIDSAEGDVIFDFTNFSKDFAATRARAVRRGAIAAQPRDFRRSGARNLLRQGVDIDAVRRYLGQTDIRTTQRYTGAPAQDVQEAGQVMSASYKWPVAPPPEPKLCLSCGRQKADPWADHGRCVFCVAVSKRKKNPTIEQLTTISRAYWAGQRNSDGKSSPKSSHVAPKIGGHDERNEAI